MLFPTKLLPLAMWFGVVALPSMVAISQAQEIDQRVSGKELWFGVLDAEVRKFRFLVELVNDDDTWSGKLVSLDEGEIELPLQSVVRSETELGFEIKATAANYSASLGEAATIAKGKWKQRTANLDLVFEKVEVPPQEKLKSRWTGQIKVLFQKINVAVRELESGEMLFDSLTQKAGGFVAKQKVSGENVEIDVPAIAGKFEGTYSADRTEIAGKWSQGLITAELVLKKDAGEAEVESVPARPQTPQAPFSYKIDEVTFQNEAAGIKLAGTLTLPATDTSSPAVVLISGSGPQDRDESLADHKPFWVIADYLARSGIAVLRFDDRGVGLSEGEFSKATSEDFASDVHAAVAFLRSLPSIDSTKIGLCGHSEGGLIAPMVAAKDNELAFIVLLAGPGVNGEQILLSQGQLILKASGATEEDLLKEQAIQRILIDLAKQRPMLDKAEFVQATQAAITPYLSEDEQAKKTEIAEAAAAQLLSPWFQYFLTYEPAPTLQKVRCPVLVLNGQRDLQVDPSLNLPAIRAALESSPARDVTVVELPELNHLFQTCKTGGLDEYQEIEETFSPKALSMIAQWILARTK